MDGQVDYTCCTPLKRDSIVRMMTVSQKNAGGQQESVSLVMVSAKGRVAVYDVSLKLTAAFTLRLSFAPVASIKAPLSNPSAPATATGTSGSKRATTAAAAGHNATSSQKMHLNGWITDCVIMDDFKSLVLASSGRCLHFFTTVVSPFVERFRLGGMKDIPTALAYLPTGGDRTEPLLAVGDDGGDVFVLRFLKPSTSLFKKREVEGEIQHVYWRELHLQAGMVALTIMPGSHNSPVLQVDLKSTMMRVASCSKNSSVALSIRQIRSQTAGLDGAIIPPVVFRTKSGITCFDYDEEKGLVVSGNSNGAIRFWSPTHLAKPWMILTGHTATIAALCLVKQATFLWSLCEQAELRYWDLSEGKCINTIQLAPTGRQEERVLFSQKPLLVLDHTLYIACGDVVATIQLSPSPSKGQNTILDTLLGGLIKEEELDDTRSAAESKIPYRFREGLLDYGYHVEDEIYRKFISDLKKLFIDSETVNQMLKEIEASGLAALDNLSLGEAPPGPVYDWEPELVNDPPLETKLIPINQIKLRELNSMEEMKKHVKEGTPFCGLKLCQPTQVELPKGLPVTGRMKKHGIKAFNSLKEVREANFDLFTDHMYSLSSARTTLATSILSYYRQKRVGEKVLPSGESDHLMVSNLSQQSSRKSSVSSLSPYSSVGSNMDK